MEIFTYALIAIGAFGWGMYFQEIVQKRRITKAREQRILIDAPFTPAQAENVMRIFHELNETLKELAKEG